MSDIIDINVAQTVEEVTINVVDNVIQVNINQVTGGGGGSQNLQQVLEQGDTAINQGFVLKTNDDEFFNINQTNSSALEKYDIVNNSILEQNLSSSNDNIITSYISGIEDKFLRRTINGEIYTKIGSGSTEIGFNNPSGTGKINFPNVVNATKTVAMTDDIPSTSTLVPYTGATTNVDLGEFELKAGQIELDTTPTGTAGVAVTRWNDTIGSSETTLKGGSVVLKNGVDLVARVVNKVTPNTTLTKAAYQVVRISGAQGQRLAVNLAQANNDNNSADTLGIVTETIATNQEGFIMTVGQLEGINTTGSLQGETWADGDVLYLSPTTAGRITNIKPTGATGHIVILGYVEYAHAVNGKIYVKIMNGWELDELHNVFIDTPLNNQALTYETSTDLWKNKTIIQDSITDGVTTVAPSQNAVFDALALKQTDLFEFNTKQGFYFFEDFLGNPVTSSFSAGYGVMPNASGTGAFCLPTTTYPNRTNQQGVMLMGTGTTATGSANIRIGDNNAASHYLGQGIYTMQYFVNIETLSDATNRFYNIIGSNTGSNFANTNGIFFLYDEGGVGSYGVGSPNFRCITRNSTITATITSTVVTASQWYVLKIVVNANASSVQFFIDNTLVATHTTNIPTLITPRIAHVKTVGTTNRSLFCDYMLVQQIYTTPRTI